MEYGRDVWMNIKYGNLLPEPAGWKKIYLRTLAAEVLLTGPFRFILSFLFSWIFIAPLLSALVAVLGWDYTDFELAFGLGIGALLGPMWVSLVHLFDPDPSGYLVRSWELGAYEVSSEIHGKVEAYCVAVRNTEFIQRMFGGWVEEPTHILIVADKAVADAEMIGSTLYVTEALMASPFFPALVTHELAYLNSRNSKLKLALKCLELPILSWIGRKTEAAGQAVGVFRRSEVAQDTACLCGCLGLLLRLSSGGIGRIVCAPHWYAYWREATYMADEFVYCCGAADRMIAYLEFYKSIETPKAYFMSNRPYANERIERLRRLKQFGPDELKFITPPKGWNGP